MSQKLFAVLTSYLRGRCAHLVRAEVKNKDGFRLWHTLCKEYMPNTRQRALALAQALSAYPTFHKDKSALESILALLAFERLVIQYEEASGSSYPLELMSTTLIRCCQPKLREQLQLSISEDSTYQEIRDKVLSFERVSKVWSTEQVLKHIQDTTSYTGGTAEGPTSMEVDRIEKGGKGKGKSKNGKGFFGSEWVNAWTYARGRGRGRQNKGTGKGKSKGKNKGKKGGSKGKGKKGGRGNKVAYGQCSNCYEYGHWAQDCPNMVNQIKQEPTGPSATALSSQQAAPKAGSPVVRRVFQFGSAPSSPTSPASTTPAQTRMVVFQDLDNEWMPISNETTDPAESEWLILDSGSDVSLLPSKFRPDGTSSLAPGALQNCQWRCAAALVYGFFLCYGFGAEGRDWKVEACADSTVLPADSFEGLNFTIHKINTKLNPSDLNTKRLSSERRRFLGRLIGLFMASERNDDNEIRQMRRVNRVTRQQCVRLVQMATAALGVCSQLKGCSSISGAGIPAEYFEKEATWAILADSVDVILSSAVQGLAMMVATVFKISILALGLSALATGAVFIYFGLLTWGRSRLTHWMETRMPDRTMGWRHGMFVYPSLQLSRWVPGNEIDYLHARFREAGQSGDMMVDLETIYHDLNEYLGGERVRVDHPREPLPPVQYANPRVEGEGEEEENEDGDDPPEGGDGGGHDPDGNDIVNMALNGVPLNGQAIDRLPNYDYEMDPQKDDEDEEMPGESPDERRTRYLNSEQGEVSDPDEWANLHYGHLDFDAYERMRAYSHANRTRFTRAANTLRQRHDEAATQTNWEEAAGVLRALHEVESLMDIA